MSRVKRGTISLKRRRKVLKQVKGFKWRRKSHERVAREALMHAWTHAYRDRRAKKRDFRSLWNIRINAAARENGTTYSKLIDTLKKSGVALDRKILADLAMNEPKIFSDIVNQAVK